MITINEPATVLNWRLPRWLSGKESILQCRKCMFDWSVSWEDPLGGGNGNLLQYACLEHPMDREAWRATYHGFAKNWTQLSDRAGSLYSHLWRTSLVESHRDPMTFSCCSVAQLCLTLCNPMNCSTLGFPVLHYLQEFTQTHVHWVEAAIQPSHPLYHYSYLTVEESVSQRG